MDYKDYSMFFLFTIFGTKLLTHTDDSASTRQTSARVIMLTELLHSFQIVIWSLMYLLRCLYRNFPRRVHVDLADEINKAL